MSELVLVVANGEWPRQEVVETLIESADFVIALDGAADRFSDWDIVVGIWILSRIPWDLKKT